MLALRDLLLNQEMASDHAKILCLVAGNIVYRMTARKLHVVHLYHTETAILATGFLPTVMVARAKEAFAGSWA